MSLSDTAFMGDWNSCSGSFVNFVSFFITWCHGPTRTVIRTRLISFSALSNGGYEEHERLRLLTLSGSPKNILFAMAFVRVWGSSEVAL